MAHQNIQEKSTSPRKRTEIMKVMKTRNGKTIIAIIHWENDIKNEGLQLHHCPLSIFKA
jgi:hypothetical protein